MKGLDLQEFDKKLKTLLEDLIHIIKKNNKEGDDQEKINNKDTKLKIKLNIEKIRNAIKNAEKTKEDNSSEGED